jgi:hypothetical protein
MRWIALTALLLLTVGAWQLIYGSLRTATEISAAVGGRAEMDAMPWLVDRRAVRVERGEALVRVRCGSAGVCRGTAALASIGSGRRLGGAVYEIPAGTDGRLRFRVTGVARGTTYATLTLSSGGATRQDEITLRRR